MTDQTAQRIREASRGLFGSSTRLEVAGYMATQVGKVVYVRQVARTLGLNDPDVKRDFNKLEEAGVIKSQDRATRNATLNYLVLPSVLWEFAVEVLHQIETGEWDRHEPQATQHSADT